MRRLALLLAAGVLAPAPAAQAATVSIPHGSFLLFEAAPGEENRVSMETTDGITYTVVDAGAPLTPGPGCAAVDAHRATCTAPGPTASAVSVRTGDRSDLVALEGIRSPLCTSANIDGGEGDDTIRTITASACWGGGFTADGGPGNDHLSVTDHQFDLVGGPGDDVLVLNAASGDAKGGEGDDRIVPSTADQDQMDGGPGSDVLDYSARTGDLWVDLAAGHYDSGEEDEYDKAVEFEGVLGGSGDDILLGTKHADTLSGGPGDDVVDGRAGPDVLFGGLGDDLADYSTRFAPVTVRLDGTPTSGSDGESDRVATDVEHVWGGAGPDTLIGNAGDNLLNGGYGADALHGGAGDDIADYSERDEDLTLRLGGTPDSGSPADSRGDAIATDIEAVVSGAGDDTIDSLDGRGADIDCGPGRDQVFVDPGDRHEHCESITIADPIWAFGHNTPQPSPPNPVAPPIPVLDPLPTVKLTLPARTRRQALTRGFTFTATCSQACRLTARLHRGGTTLARGQAGASGRVQLRFTAAGKRALRGDARVRATLEVRAVDRRGRAVTVRRTFTLR
ncbi:hypothetical protein OJ998_02755 [Solirubrobacter taibaiensis]|nr:hypothetical protein [Solirubrobacter taibaiensis]